MFFIEKDLKQLGIEVIGKLPDETVIDISGKVARKIMETFSNLKLDYLEIYKKLIETPMYYANISKKISDANYFYKNSSIYFSKTMNFEQIDEYVFHECVHKIQEHRDKKGNITRLGLCAINEITVTGTALNEAAVQYITTASLKNTKKMTTVYDITLPVNTEYYPIITNLISQIAYLIGEDILVDSTLNSNEEFKCKFIDSCGEGVFNQIQSNFDEILKAKNNILSFQENGIASDKIMANSELIRKLYIETQNLIYTSYFNISLKRLDTVIEIEQYIKKLKNYEKLIGKVLGYNDFDLYYIKQLEKAKIKANEIKRKNSLALIKDNKIARFFIFLGKSSTKVVNFLRR